jgi:hypothetical protein
MEDTREYEQPDDKTEAGLLRYWRTEISLASKREENFRKSAKSVIKRYKGDAGGDEKTNRGPAFNILYSNTETLKPSLYARTPVPDIRQRHPDVPNPVVKDAARVLERAVTYIMDVYDFDACMNAVVSDYVLPGRGVVRVRYEPEVKDEILGYQKLCFEPVNWQDYRCGQGRNRDEVPWEAFRHCLTRDEARKQFGDKAKGLKLDVAPEGMEDKEDRDALKRVTVWEIWDKTKKSTLFVAIDGNNKLLQKIDDNPLRLDQFFCTPRPLISVETTDDMTPEPEFHQYQSLADELEEVTKRIQALTRGIKARGGYAGSMKDDLQAILNADENDLVPMENATQLVMSGKSITDAVWMWPVEMLAAVQEKLYQRRADIIQSIYEITGISDILRGSSDPNETATAQNIKAQFGSQRMNKRQRDVQRFARDLIRLGCEIIAAQFTAENLTALTGIQVTPEMMQILRSDVAMSFVIDIETDSTISEDLMMAQQRANEFVQGMGAWMQTIMPLVQTGGVPKEVAVEMTKSYAQRFKMGRSVEEAIDKMGQTPAPPPGPSKEQIDGQIAQQELALKGQELQGKAVIDQQKLQLEAQRVQIEQQRLQLEAQTVMTTQQREDARFNMDGQRFNFERENAEKAREFEGQKFAYSKRSGEMARRDANRGVEGFEADPLEEDMKNMEAILQASQEQNAQMMQQFMQVMQGMVQQIAAGQQQLAQAISTPKRIVYENGRPVGSEPVTMQ